MLREWSRAAAEMTAGRADRRRQPRRAGAARRHRRDGRPAALQPDRHLRLRPRACSSSRGLGLAAAAPGGAAPDPAAAGRRAGPARKRRRHLRPGLLRRPPGRLPRDPQPGPDRPRHGGDALVPARLRPHLDHQPQPGHAAQPDGDEGRHRQHPRRGHSGDEALRLGRRRGPGLDARRQLPGDAPDPDAARGLGPLLAGRPGADDRPPQVQRRPARRLRRVRPARPRRREPDGQPTIPVDAHVRLASAQVNDGERILRRGYSFTDGVDESLGELEAGLFFIAFQRDPEKQFVAIQRRLGSSDALNEYIKHVGSAVFAVPPGARQGGYVGETLLG